MGRTPGFTAIAVLSLALGIGANTAISTLLNALLLRELPVREPERLVQLSAVRRNLPARRASRIDHMAALRAE